jgi:Zn-dependent oligopeptidase
MKPASDFLSQLNRQYTKLHKDYEELFWISYMGDHSVDKRKDEALAKRDEFRSSKENYETTKSLLKNADAKEKQRLKIWLDFFSHYQSSPETLLLKNKIDALESDILAKKAKRKEGYIDPKTKKFVECSSLKMRMFVSTHPDEAIRKACFVAREKMSAEPIKEYIKITNLRNEYAKALGYPDFYSFKVESEDGMTKKELFSLFDSLYQKTKYAFADVRKLERKMPGLRKPWNFGFMMAGDFTREDDPYFQFDQSLIRWGRSFAALDIDFKKGKLQLDLLDRKGKWNNGFCHWPDVVHFEGSTRVPGSSNFTCNVVAGQVGSGIQGYNTLFHEGGHAAHILNTEQREVILNTEYPPAATAWDETQSMFLDTLFSGIDWKTRYAKDANGNPYPFELYERKLRKLHLLRPQQMNSILFVSQFEKEIYEAKNLTVEKVKQIAKKNYKKYFDFSEDSLMALGVPHIYSWESSGAYHNYGLAELALAQWRAYFYKKYGYIVDNPNVGKEMRKVWELGSARTFKEFVKLATGKQLSADAFVSGATMPIEKALAQAKAKIKRMEKVKEYKKPVKLNAEIKMVDGKKEIANNKKSFEDMAEKYGEWVKKQAKK